MERLAGVDRGMKLFRCFAIALSLVSSLFGEEVGYKSQLFAQTKLVYAEDFSSGTFDKERWEVRQNTTWVVKEGVLHGSESSKEFQEKKKASGDPSHAGLKPVMWLKGLPENLVCSMRVRYDAKAYQKGFPLLDLGHHIHTLSFGETGTTLTVKKNAERKVVQQPLFSLNAWHDVVIEIKKGTLLLQVDGVKQVFESPHIDMKGHSQIDFKAVDYGTCQIDSVKVWEGS
jgi:hypothetical protein